MLTRVALAQQRLIFVLSYYCRYFLVGTLTATDHLMFTALVCAHLKISKKQLLTV